MNFDWKQLVGSVAPTIATALGGPLAGMATKALATALGCDDAEVEEVLQNATPEQLVVLKQADQEFKLRMKELDIDLVKLANQDRQGARELFRVNKWPQIILSGLFIMGYFSILALLGTGHITPGEALRDAFLLLLGVVTREVPTIMQFWFGSSEGSKDKAGVMAGAK